jgi:Zn-dependent protease with chaperone function
MPTSPAEVLSGSVFSPSQVLFPDISYKSFTYPGDEEALAALKKVPGVGALLTYLQENFTEQLIFVKNNEEMIRASANCFPSLHKLTARCSEILSCPVPDLYVTNSPVMNAYTVGHRRTCIVLHSALIECMTADELSFVIGHEIGHIKCGHGLYRQLGDLLIRYWDAVVSLSPVPGLGLLRIPLLLAFWEWYRRAEFTCDRAGLLCVQNPEAGCTALAKLAGKVDGFENEFSVDSAIAQTQAHAEVNKLVLVVSILDNADNTHPFVPVRLKQIREYAAGEQYARILKGEYERDALGLHEGGLRVKCECGAKVNSKLAFCPECGKPITADQPAVAGATPVCAACGRELAPGVKFCVGCGAKQETVADTAASAVNKFKSTAAGFLKR